MVQWLSVRQSVRWAAHVQRISAANDRGSSGAIDHTSRRMSRVHKPFSGCRLTRILMHAVMSDTLLKVTFDRTGRQSFRQDFIAGQRIGIGWLRHFDPAMPTKQG